jgi:hypothetical protein
MNRCILPTHFAAAHYRDHAPLHTTETMLAAAHGRFRPCWPAKASGRRRDKLLGHATVHLLPAAPQGQLACWACSSSAMISASQPSVLTRATVLTRFSSPKTCGSPQAAVWLPGTGHLGRGASCAQLPQLWGAGDPGDAHSCRSCGEQGTLGMRSRWLVFLWGYPCKTPCLHSQRHAAALPTRGHAAPRRKLGCEPQHQCLLTACQTTQNLLAQLCRQLAAGQRPLRVRC